MTNSVGASVFLADHPHHHHHRHQHHPQHPDSDKSHHHHHSHVPSRSPPSPTTPQFTHNNQTDTHPDSLQWDSTLPPKSSASCRNPEDCHREGATYRTGSPPFLRSPPRLRSDHPTRPSYLPLIPSLTELDEHFSETDSAAAAAAAPDDDDDDDDDSNNNNNNDDFTSHAFFSTGQRWSQPIPIAVPRTKPRHTGLTPLSGRPPPSYLLDRSFCARSRTPSPSSSFHTHYSTPLSALSLDRHPYNMAARPSQSSPLSPTAPAQPMTIPRRHEQQPGTKQPQSRPTPRPRPAAQDLNLAGLPKYHPANFPTSGDNTPLSPRTIQALNASKRNPRPGSDAQHALHKYQRQIVSRASGLSELAKPTSPRLIPEGSPSGTMTPLALEAQSDYLLSASNLPANAAEARNIVDQILQKENEGRRHPEARRTSPSQSPAVTPPV